jgi:hypothetical protein
LSDTYPAYSSRLDPPPFFSGRPTCAHASLSSLPLPPPAEACLSISVTARHCGRGPPVSLSPPPLFGWSRVHRARRLPVSGRCRPGAVRQSAGTPLLVPPLPPCVGRAPRPPPHPLPHPPPPKKGSHDAVMLWSPFPSSILTPSTPRAEPPIAFLTAPPSKCHPPPHFRPHRSRRSPAR